MILFVQKNADQSGFWFDASVPYFTWFFIYLPTCESNRRYPCMYPFVIVAFFSEFKKAVKLVVETVHFDKSNVVQVPVFNFSFHLLVLTAVLWRSGSEFCFVADPEPDPDPTPSFTHVGKSESFLIFIHSSLHCFNIYRRRHRCQNVHYFGQFIGIFRKKFSLVLLTFG